MDVAYESLVSVVLRSVQLMTRLLDSRHAFEV
jgi:hypothetical protein